MHRNVEEIFNLGQGLRNLGRVGEINPYDSVWSKRRGLMVAVKKIHESFIIHKKYVFIVISVCGV